MILSVVLPTCNKKDLLARTLTALVRQQLEGEWEIVVVDDGSGDGTDELLAGFVAKHSRLVRQVSAGRNLGRAGARNLGARAALGEWVLFMDDDIVAPPGLLAAHRPDAAIAQQQNVRSMPDIGIGQQLCRKLCANPGRIAHSQRDQRLEISGVGTTAVECHQEATAGGHVCTLTSPSR